MSAERSAPSAGPIGQADRLETVDVLRGFALLGILPMNLPFFADTSAAFFNPALSGGFTGVNYALWLFGHVFFELKMMSIFSMLFGAGLIVMNERSAAAGRSLAAVYYRRIGWLLVIGLAHAYLLWYGDILVTYALCGLALYPLRRLKPLPLVALGAALLLTGMLVQFGLGLGFDFLRGMADEVSHMTLQGETPARWQRDAAEQWAEISADFMPGAAALAAERADYLQGGWDLFNRRAGESLSAQLEGFAFFSLWRAGGLMLIGMALMKSGFLRGALPSRVYALVAALGLSIGTPLIVWGAARNQEANFDIVHMFTEGLLTNAVGSLLMMLAYASLIALVCRSGALPALRRGLAGVGRMALTNYLMQSVLCTTLFYGYGLGLFGALDRVGWWYVVLVIWAFQLGTSRLWLEHFRFGPAEWAWRSLTYWRVQPMRIRPAQPRNERAVASSPG
ncbi:MAG: DUF418 domain-containing protein [Planctomycetota bacterium]|nr:DUF418 domain-containing protein [Planctomycetota bacterium]